jgi:hypothetical protein
MEIIEVGGRIVVLGKKAEMRLIRENLTALQEILSDMEAEECTKASIQTAMKTEL